MLAKLFISSLLTISCLYPTNSGLYDLDNEFPYVYRTFTCSSVGYDKKYLLTAYHCLPYKTDYYTVNAFPEYFYENGIIAIREYAKPINGYNKVKIYTGIYGAGYFLRHFNDIIMMEIKKVEYYYNDNLIKTTDSLDEGLYLTYKIPTTKRNKKFYVVGYGCGEDYNIDCRIKYPSYCEYRDMETSGDGTRLLNYENGCYAIHGDSGGAFVMKDTETNEASIVGVTSKGDDYNMFGTSLSKVLSGYMKDVLKYKEYATLIGGLIRINNKEDVEKFRTYAKEHPNSYLEPLRIHLGMWIQRVTMEKKVSNMKYILKKYKERFVNKDTGEPLVKSLTSYMYFDEQWFYRKCRYINNDDIKCETNLEIGTLQHTEDEPLIAMWLKIDVK
jgi:hypothetical protein